ncbi:MAG: hypothetical protein M1828_004016 [Chrysothrix sp. TS-e1954]|nr:MAG: hypothetical protein M1828_004016 [Chrysothrix sp. TS-e1954]
MTEKTLFVDDLSHEYSNETTDVTERYGSFLHAIWPRARSPATEYEAFARYLQWNIDLVSWPSKQPNPSLYAARTQTQLANMILIMKHNAHLDRTKLVERLQTQFPGMRAIQIRRSMDLAVRLWLTLHVRSTDCLLGPKMPHISIVSWDEDMTLAELIRTSLPLDETNPAVSTGVRASGMSPGFNIANLRRLCSVGVDWATSLQDHLRYDRTTNRVTVYPHAVVLASHASDGADSVYPTDFLKETLRTLDVLFPLGDVATRRYLRDCGQTQVLRTHWPGESDGSRCARGGLSALASLDEFAYWRPRMLELTEVFDRPPESFRQLWTDRRNAMAWWTFWLAAIIALLTVVFGIITSYASFRQVALAQASLRLALAQAEDSSQLEASRIRREHLI